MKIIILTFFNKFLTQKYKYDLVINPDWINKLTTNNSINVFMLRGWG